MGWGSGDVQRLSRSGGLTCFAHPVSGVVSRGHAQYRAFAPDTLHLLQAPWKWQVAFLVSLYLLSRVCPNCTCLQLFLVPTISFAFCFLGRGVSRCKPWAQDPKAWACDISTRTTNKPKHILFPSCHFLVLANLSLWCQWHKGQGKTGQPTAPFLSVSFLNN